MSMTGSKFKLGLFFLIGLFLSIILVIWLSGGFREQNTTIYVSYFPWSVQGLTTGGNVMYNGVPVGHVYGIDIAPDGRLVEVMMKIRSDFSIDSTIVATMQLIGITGLQVINLSADSVNVIHRRHYNFNVEYQIIPVGEGAIQNVTSTLTRISRIIYEVDFQSISDQFLQLLKNTNAILASDLINNIENSIISNSSNLDSLLVVYTQLGRDLDRLVLRLEYMAPEFASDMDSMIVELRSLSELLGRFAGNMDEVLVESSEMLRRLSSLLEILGNNPAELLIRTSGEGVWQ